MKKSGFKGMCYLLCCLFLLGSVQIPMTVFAADADSSTVIDTGNGTNNEEEEESASLPESVVESTESSSAPSDSSESKVGPPPITKPPSTVISGSFSDASASMDESSKSLSGGSSFSDSSEVLGITVAQAETSIAIPDGQTLVLGAENKFLLRTDGGADVEIPIEEWEAPAGLYDKETLVTAAGEAAFIRSIVPVALAGMNGPAAGDLTIVDGSDITITTLEDVGVSGHNIYVGNMDTPTATRLHVEAALVGLGFSNAFKCGPNTQIFAKAANNAIAYTGNEIGSYYENVIVKYGSEFILTATGENGVALYVDSIQLQGTKITATAPAGTGGILVENSLMMSQDSGIRTVIWAESQKGRAISCSSIEMQSSDLSGKTPEGSIGVHANNYLNITTLEAEQGQPSTVYGSAKTGYGVVAQTIDDGDQEFPSGSIYLQDGRLEGYVEEGIGISTNMVSMYSPLDYIPEVKGVAEKGIGISVCMVSISSRVNIHGISRGASKEHFQVYGSIPDSAGINCLSYLIVSYSSTVIGEAPMDVPGSYGIHVQLAYEGGAVGGELYLSDSQGERIKLKARGETGLFATRISLGGHSDIDIEGSKDGIVTTGMNAYVSDEESRSTINAKGTSGCGIKIYSEWENNFTEFSFTSIDISATGGEYGIFASYNSEPIISNSSINAVAKGPEAVAGAYIYSSPMDQHIVRKVTIENSTMEAVSPKHGWLFLDTALMINANDYALNQPGFFKGAGGEDGIKLEFSDEFADEYSPTGSMALQLEGQTMPDGNPYRVWGVSTGDTPDQSGREAAVAVPSALIGAGTILREEYTMPAKGQITSNTPYFVYAAGMNIEDYTSFSWQTPDRALGVTAEGLTAQGNGIFKASVIAQRSVAPVDAVIGLDGGLHEIQLLSDINIGEVTFNGNGGTPVPAKQLVPIGGLVTQPEEITKEGYAFGGWKDASTGTIWNFSSSTLQSPTLQLNAQWNAIQYTLTFDGNAQGDITLSGMPSPATKVLSTGSLISKPASEPKRDGYKFLHWAADASGANPWDFENGRMPAKNLSLFAIWERQSFEVTYQGMGGRPAIQKETVPFGSKIPGKIQIPTRDGFAFTGWYTDWGLTTLWNPDTTMPNYSLTLYAGWNRLHSKISFDLNGGQASNKLETLLVTPGETVDINKYLPGGSDAPFYAGHFFLGWIDDAGKAVEGSFVMPEANIQLKAQWQEIPAHDLPAYTVAYRNTKSKTEIEDLFRYTFEYTDLLGQVRQLTPSFSWDTNLLTKGGVGNIEVKYAVSTSPAILSVTAQIYVLNQATITANPSQIFTYGQEINTDGREWNPSCISEQPDLTTKTIQKVALPTLFHYNGTNTRIAGTYNPFFTAVYSDYFGVIHNLNQPVTAIVLPRGAVSSSSSSSSSSSTSSSAGTSGSGATASSSRGGTSASANSGAGGTSASGPVSNPQSSTNNTPTTPEEYRRVNQETLNQLREQNVPILQIGNTQIPLYGGGLRQVWGLANLMLLILSLSGSGLLLFAFINRRRKAENQPMAKRDKGMMIGAMVVAPVMGILFLITQNTRYLMTLFDRWTALMVCLGLVQLTIWLVMLYWNRKGKSPIDIDSPNDEETTEEKT